MEPMPTPVSSSSSAAEGFALTCSRSGDDVTIVRETLSGVDLRDSFAEAVDPASREACLVFLRSIARGGFARSTPLRIGTRDVQCFGFGTDDGLSIIGIINPMAAASFAEVVGSENDPRFLRVAEEIRRTHSTYELYEELARLNNDLVTAQRELARTVGELRRLNAYKDELLGMAAHDLRNPLNANAAFISFLLEDAESSPDKNVVLLQRLQSNSDFMLRLVENVLDFSAIESGHVNVQLQETDVEDLVTNVVLTMRILAEAKNVSIRAVVEKSLPPLQVDRVKIMQSLQNLVSNAVQYTAPHTTVDVHVTRTERFVEMRVEDRGPGIRPEDLPSLFKPFTRLSTVKFSRQRSIGLGLAITKRLVEAHGGSIEVQSEEGTGSVFTMKLPL
jgi:signal transduction histidine kinase